MPAQLLLPETSAKSFQSNIELVRERSVGRRKNCSYMQELSGHFHPAASPLEDSLLCSPQRPAAPFGRRPTSMTAFDRGFPFMRRFSFSFSSLSRIVGRRKEKTAKTFGRFCAVRKFPCRRRLRESLLCLTDLRVWCYANALLFCLFVSFKNRWRAGCLPVLLGAERDALVLVRAKGCALRGRRERCVGFLVGI